jgi:hypothetical protein
MTAMSTSTGSGNGCSPNALNEPVTLCAFDVLWLDGIDCTQLPYRDRRRLLEMLELSGPAWCTVPRFVVDDAEDLLAACVCLRQEAIVLKRLDARYLPGARSTDWRKVKTAAWRTDLGSRGLPNELRERIAHSARAARACRGRGADQTVIGTRGTYETGLWRALLLSTIITAPTKITRIGIINSGPIPATSMKSPTTTTATPGQNMRSMFSPLSDSRAAYHSTRQEDGGAQEPRATGPRFNPAPVRFDQGPVTS